MRPLHRHAAGEAVGRIVATPRSFAVMERLGIRRAFAYDRHFAVAGFELISA
ncbi:MAG: hypothetical protein ABIP01_06865 [Candidatus Limnocylindria bacterium]